MLNLLIFPGLLLFPEGGYCGLTVVKTPGYRKCQPQLQVEVVSSMGRCYWNDRDVVRLKIIA